MDTFQDVIVPIVLCIIFGLGLALNIGLIALICQSHYLATLPNYLLMNLFVSNIVLACGIPLSFVGKVIGDNLCSVIQCSCFIHLHINSFTLILAAIERYSVIARPAGCICFRRTNYFILYLTMIWCQSLMISVPTIMIFNQQGLKCGLISQSRIVNIVC